MSGVVLLDGARIDGLAPHVVAAHRVARTLLERAAVPACQRPRQCPHPGGIAC